MRTRSSGSRPNSDRVRVENPFLKERAAVRNKYQRKERKSNHKFEVVGGQELMVRVPLPMAEVWAEMQAKVEELTGQAGLQILRAILENEVTRRVGPPHRPNPTAGCVRWGKQPGYVVFAGQKIPLERPRVRTREGQEVELESYGQLQQDGKLQRAVRERLVAGLSTRNYRRAVESVVEGYGIAKSSVSRQFVEASSNQLRVLCERRLEDLHGAAGGATTAPAPSTPAHRPPRTCDWTCALSSGICFSRRLSPLKRDSQPELYPSSGESRCFLFSSFN